MHQPSGGKILGDRKANGQRGAPDAHDLLQRGGIALEDPLLGLRNRQAAQHGCDLTIYAAGGRTQHPLLVTQQRGHRNACGQWAIRRDDGDDLILQEGP
ncbi:Uncharacterised protein [Mycobacterium tuberculosis]|nr:Uncharacterised protein [Mycobacterium tuberculosis]COY40017.1 Uncharacterised protein [Mycobacterium tuberculosis]